MHIQPSPVVALNRAVAIAQREGPARGLEEIGRIADRRCLLLSPFYFTALGEFEFRLGHLEKRRNNS
jgi:RNA polymerase sigma-70 factor (ECF subfamily)